MADPTPSGLSTLLSVAGGAAKGGAEVQAMVGADGTPYTCVLPRVGGAGAVEEMAGKRETEGPALGDILKTLKGQCILKVEGWWTYEFCFEKHVQQFHAVSNGAFGRRASEFTLGRFSGEATRALQRKAAPGAPPAALRQAYSSGTTCDLTKEARHAEVTFTCVEGLKGSALVSVEEPATCVYDVVIAMQQLCKHPHFKKKEELIQTVSCTPEVA